MDHKILKKIYSNYRDFENLITTSSGFLLILAFVIVIPSLSEFRLAWLGAFITFAVAINITIKRIETEFPKLKLEEDFRRSIDEIESNFKRKLKGLNNQIKKIEKEVHKK